MYTCFHFFDNSNREGEKSVNPQNLSIRPSDIANLTAEGRATCQQALTGSLHYPNIDEDILPLEYMRGVDLNDAWEASQVASEKVKNAAKEVSAKNNNPTSES